MEWHKRFGPLFWGRDEYGVFLSLVYNRAMTRAVVLRSVATA